MRLGELASFADMRSAANHFYPGDVLYGKMRPYLNKVHHTRIEGACSAEFIVFPYSDNMISGFIAYLLHDRRFVRFASGQTSGDRPRVDLSDLLGYEVGLPPLAEQRRIVEKIDELFSLIEAGERALERARRLLERYRQSVLKAAVTGELTRDWRERHRGQIEPADALLARILKARREAWEAAELERMQRRGTEPKDDRWKQRYVEPAQVGPGELAELPQGWLWSSLGQLFEVFGGATPSRSKQAYWNGDIPWVSSGEVAFCRVAQTRERITKLGLAETSTRLHPPGTILVAMIGEGKTRGQAAILDIAACNNQNAAAVRVAATQIPPEFVFYVLMERYEETRRGSSGGNQPALNGDKVKEIPLPVPPLAEILEIVERLAEEFSRIDRVGIEITEQVKRSSALRQSILTAAFSGKLVPQDPSDEPASALLARLRAERSGAGGSTFGRGRRARAVA
jgi:type I restriction enzyme S subunit